MLKPVRQLSERAQRIFDRKLAARAEHARRRAAWEESRRPKSYHELPGPPNPLPGLEVHPPPPAVPDFEGLPEAKELRGAEARLADMGRRQAAIERELTALKSPGHDHDSLRAMIDAAVQGRPIKPERVSHEAQKIRDLTNESRVLARAEVELRQRISMLRNRFARAAVAACMSDYRRLAIALGKSLVGAARLAKQLHAFERAAADKFTCPDVTGLPPAGQTLLGDPADPFSGPLHHLLTELLPTIGVTPADLGVT